MLPRLVPWISVLIALIHGSAIFESAWRGKYNVRVRDVRSCTYERTVVGVRCCVLVRGLQLRSQWFGTRSWRHFWVHGGFTIQASCNKSTMLTPTIAAPGECLWARRSTVERWGERQGSHQLPAPLMPLSWHRHYRSCLQILLPTSFPGLVAVVSCAAVRAMSRFDRCKDEWSDCRVAWMNGRRLGENWEVAEGHVVLSLFVQFSPV